MAKGRLNSSSRQEQDLPKARLSRETLIAVSRLLGYLRPYRQKFILAMIFLLLSSLVGLAFPSFIGSLIDAAQGRYSSNFLPRTIQGIGLLAITVLFLQGFISFFRILWFVQVAELSLADIRRDTYLNLMTLPMDFFSNRRVGELNSRIAADLSQIQDTLTSTIAEMIRQLILLLGGLVFLAVISPRLTFTLLLVLPVLILAGVFFGRFIRKISRQAQDKLADSNTIVEETLQGIASVKAFVNESFEAARYSKNIGEVARIAIRGARYRGLFASFIVFGLFGTIVCVIAYGCLLVSHHELTVGQLFKFALYAAFVGSAMGSFPEMYANVQRAVGASERVLELLAEKGEEVSLAAVPAVTEKISGDIALKDVGFHYPSRPGTEVLHSVSFHAAAGQRIALVGPSGSGKSTIAALILQFYQPQGGTVLFDGRPASSYALTDIRNQVAVVPQDVLLFGGTIRENIAYGRLSASPEEIARAAGRANADQFIRSFPEGYDTIVGERGVKLSGGQRQRIAIARAVLKDPAILILDEATSSLDSESERLVQEALEELMKNRTSIIIAHRLSTIREADNIIVLEKGRVTESGSHQELLANPQGLYRYLSQLQFEA